LYFGTHAQTTEDSDAAASDGARPENREMKALKRELENTKESETIVTVRQFTHSLDIFVFS